MGRSKLRIPAAAHGTARNINTIAKLSEMAASLGRAGDRAARALAELAALDAGNAGTGQAPRENALREAAVAVHAWFIQRELCGLRRHDDVIRELNIPRAVLARLGAR